MQITGLQFNYYQICKRKLWLYVNQITFEHTSDMVYEGKLIHEGSYPHRSERYEEVELDGVKVDYYDAKNKVIHEIKKSNKIEEAHRWQLKYYIYVFERNGINGVNGILEYPTLRQIEQVCLMEEDRVEIVKLEKEIQMIAEADECPAIRKRPLCKSCSYYDFCYCNEEE